MEDKVFDGVLYTSLLEGGVLNLHNNISIVNNLNVFPIPDGDTGDNMWLTINGGYKFASDNLNTTSISKISRIASDGMVMKARGNSGAILSQFFSGIADGLSNKNSISVKDFAFALTEGVKKAYTAVNVPTEGTILTVAREASDYANERLTDNTTLQSFFEIYLRGLKESLKRTPDLLDVLKEAGVVDSGGAGLVYIFDGMLKVLNGEKIEQDGQYNITVQSSNDIDYSKFTEDSVMEFGYCTEFLLRLQNSKVDIKNFDLNIIIDFLNSVGDSVVCFKTDSIVKAHVHTFHPGVVFNEVQKYGEFLTLKVENMNIQHENTIIENRYIDEQSVKKKKYGIVTVATGDGIINTFKDLGVDYVIHGGQSMNPSTEDFINAFETIHADNIFVLPNNGNVILTANMSANLYKESNIIVIETKNIGEGYAAISMFDPSYEDVNEVKEAMISAFDGTVTGMVSPCVRDSVMNGVQTSTGEYIGFINKRIYTSKPTSKEALLELADDLSAKDYSVIIVIYGNDETEENANEIQTALKQKYKYSDIYMINGGQEIYNFILILE